MVSLAAIKFALALLFAAALIAFPDTALHAAQEAMASWASSVAPVLFPFAAVVPMLSCREARAVYDRLFGKLVEWLFGLPGRCASAIAVGLVAGSPAGAMAVRNIATEERIDSGQAARLAGIVCGVSPMFAISFMGVSLLGSKTIGIKLAISQLVGQIITGILFRSAFKGKINVISADGEATYASPVTNAVSAVLRVCGYMVLFSVGMAMCERVVGEWVHVFAPFADLPSGIIVLFETNKPVFLYALALGFGGFCIAGQNMSVLKQLGVGWKEYLLQKMTSAIACTGVFSAIDAAYKPACNVIYSVNDMIFEGCVLISMVILIPVILFFMIKRPKKHFS